MSDDTLRETIEQAIKQGLKTSISEDTIEDLSENIAALSEVLAEAVEGNVPEDVSVFERLGEALGALILGLATDQIINRVFGSGGNRMKKVVGTKVGKTVGARVGSWVGKAVIAALIKFIAKPSAESDTEKPDSTTKPTDETNWLPVPIQETADSGRLSRLISRLTETVSNIIPQTIVPESADETN